MNNYNILPITVIILGLFFLGRFMYYDIYPEVGFKENDCIVEKNIEPWETINPLIILQIGQNEILTASINNYYDTKYIFLYSYTKYSLKRYKKIECPKDFLEDINDSNLHIIKGY